MCGVPTTSGAAFWNDVRVPTNCEPFDKALEVYVNEYVHLRSSVLPPPWKCTCLLLIHESQPFQAGSFFYPSRISGLGR